ncbi:xanthine dehydrogenase family protein molybdopterin-binding subunit [Sedimentibacter sp. MB31-C6]|uniref:xanthine dehydrogenase family protein molybdopterin-binding subunit n=1 Tax=Sedimentibacter sp. MB31-C6 TaxID=3109366 RepID=UPI002DDCD571|nr:molybdopterin cofactor-binding domain-containing protein [Sedimentibacter sp. MB36-C1]WSI04894.1 molybdopterin cofactor-binding domain-containing protein [Sedimentibacter sp. MB36-C1]
MEQLKYVGKSVIREDSYDKATGKTKFICDMKRHNMLYAKLVLSKKPHAEIEVDKSEAIKVEGIEAIYTYDDVPHVLYNSHEWYAGAKEFQDEYLLCNKARFVGDRIALVVGTSKKAVQKAISKLSIAYIELDSVIGINQAKQNAATVNGNTNLAFAKKINCGNYEEKFKDADFIIRDTGKTPKIHHSAIEPHICLSELDEQGSLVVWSPCQTAFQIQYHVASVLNIPFNRVRVIKAAMGGSFGGKGHTVLEPICAFAAYKLNRPVMLYMDRKDAILGTRSRNATEISVETAIKADGKILGRKIVVDIDGGAYYTNSSAIAMALGKKLFRLYDIQDQYYEGNTYYTNTIPGGPCRGYGSPQAHAITEINIDNVAKKIGMDPCDFRLKNLVKEGAKDPTGGTEIGNTKIIECVINGMKKFDWKNKRQNIKNKNTHRYAYGVGMACGAHGNGYKGAHPDFTNVDMSIFSDGSVLVKIGIHEQGCGTVTTMQQIASESLDINMDKVRVLEVDTITSPYDSAGTQASRVTFVCGGAVKSAGEKLKKKLIDSFCKLKNCRKENVIATNGIIYEKNSEEKYTYGEIAIELELKYHESLSVFERYESPANPGTYSASFAEVKVDKYTGQVEIIDLLAVHDIGKSINPLLVEGQIQGGAQFSLGMALLEEIKIDEKGYVKSTNFSKYHMINAPQMPEVRVMTIEGNEPFGPYGAKSVGEIAAVAPGPAVLNAINFALDTNITTYPATPEVIIRNVSR